ncbi:hypothetical protein BLA24_27230 [Streptomyces cinnamoneus]|uniref:Uncharacterized protein n=1 Tax=Streptomyces cinnamoneus TaxID=53446 RepID=A0A2G1XC05_STRCJ|nr:hypothetical protein [Streptomyces cinnamoneus]PHQ48773.1 hypothetical protein BLA24_27230 [Streptomyces cinnamoneus]PPT14579.1 hypothetical protein CYQ11_18425 [Streptomyces cinnamoneus]
MPDRRRHAAHRPPLPAAIALRGRQSPPSNATGSEDQRDNPFAAPPEGRPDRPWQPRQPQPPAGDGDGDGEGGSGQQPPAWGSQWSNRQPGRQDGGFGGQGGGPGGPNPSGGGPGGGLRWDPTDPAQRRARYALLAGMWGFFFALFSIPQVALLLGALSVYWGISALRAKSKPRDPDTPAPAPTAGGFRPQTTAAVSGLVTGGLALAIVAATFTVHLVYRDYYTCVDDALTQTSLQSCENHLPKQLRPLLGSQD